VESRTRGRKRRTRSQGGTVLIRIARAIPVFRLTLVAFAVAITVTRADAQSLRTTKDNFNAWLNVIGEVEFTKRWFVDYDVSFRRNGPLERWQSILPRAGIRYQALPNLRLTWGYAFAETWPYGKLPIAFKTPEHRMWEQVQVNSSVGRVSLANRYRLEQRWQGRVALENGEEEVQNWVRLNRFRYRLLATLPLEGKTLDDGEFYLSANDEIFLGFGANVQQNVFDQNRIALNVGRRFSKDFRMEIGYLQQLNEKPTGRALEKNHTIVVGLYPSFSLTH
jgi:hypothetical protein